MLTDLHETTTVPETTAPLEMAESQARPASPADAAQVQSSTGNAVPAESAKDAMIWTGIPPVGNDSNGICKISLKV